MRRRALDAGVFLGAGLLFAGLTLAYLRPTGFGHSILPDRGDPVLNLYILKWVARQIALGLPDLWNANFFYPLQGALALSDHLLAPAVELLGLERLTGCDALTGYTVLLLTSFGFSGWTTFWVARRMGVSVPAAVVAGIAFAFSPFRWSQLSHLQILLMQWIPLVLWLGDRLLAEPTPRRAAAFVPVYLLHLFGGAYLAYMVHVPLLVILLVRGATDGRRLLAARSLRVLVPVALVAALAGLALFVPYARERDRLGIERHGHEVARMGATLWSFVNPASANFYAPVVRQAFDTVLPEDVERLRRKENSLFPGFVPAALALIGGVTFVRRYRRPPLRPLSVAQRLVLAGLVAAALLAYVHADAVSLSVTPLQTPPLDVWDLDAAVLGGALVAFATLYRRFAGRGLLAWGEVEPWERSVAIAGAVCWILCHPVAFAPLMRVLPGLDGLRVPSRFFAFTSLAVALFAARGFDASVLRIATPHRRVLAALAILSLAAIEPMPRGIRWLPLESEVEFAPVYRWLARQPEVAALLELPVRGAVGETPYMYYSTAHWRPIANGFSSFAPPTYVELVAAVRPLPEEDGLALLRRFGVTHLVVHATAPAPFFQAGLASWRLRHVDRDLLEVYPEDERGDRVYRIVATR